MQLAQLYLKLTLVTKHKNRHIFFLLFQIDCICTEQIRRTNFNLAGIDFVSRKVRIFISMHVSGYNVPGLNPYFIPLFQFVDKVS